MLKKKFTCGFCGIEFENEYPISSSKEIKYCSQTCRSKAPRKAPETIAAYGSVKERVFECQNCKKQFTPDYRITASRVMKYCSQSCRSVVVGKKNSLKRGDEDWNREKLVEAIKSVIAEAEKYCSTYLITHKLGISEKTLRKYDVKIAQLNIECGYSQAYSEFENRVYDALMLVLDKEIIRDRSMPGCISPKGRVLRFDFQIPELKLLVEADGKQHQINDKFSDFGYLHECDKIKDRYAAEHGYKLVRIPYTRKEEVLDSVMSLISPYLTDKENKNEGK